MTAKEMFKKEDYDLVVEKRIEYKHTIFAI